jgi:PPM family protein phosphatase
MIRIDEAHLEIAAASHPGMTGKKNEDRYGVTPFLTGPKGQTPAVLAVLCDGIGGHRAGEVAALMGVSIIAETVAASDGSQPLNTLNEAIKRANHAIYAASLSDQGRKGMGATCACAWVIDDRLYTANLGDSRIYLLREGHILQLSTDHTWVQEAFDAGIIDETQGEAHPNAHVIRRYLGSPIPPHPDFRLWFFEGEGDAEALDNQGLPLVPGDIVLVCSDGLTDLVSDDEIRLMVKAKPLDEVANALIDLANKRGGHDNITVVTMRVPTGPERAFRKPRKRRRLVGCLAVLALLLVLAVAVYFGGRWQAARLVPTVTASPTATQPPPTLIPIEIQLTLTPNAIATPTSMEVLATPRSTITPWPTHTLAP